jgi:shikimate kinase
VTDTPQEQSPSDAGRFASAGGPGHVFVIGFMGAGKTTVGRLMAEELGVPFVDLDALVEDGAGCTVGQLFQERGEAGFRELESEALASTATLRPSVVACGGGVVLRPGNRELMGALGCVIYLVVTAGEALARIGDVEGRPLLAAGGPDVAATLLAARERLYAATANVVVDTTGKGPEAVARQAADALKAAGCAR